MSVQGDPIAMGGRRVALRMSPAMGDLAKTPVGESVRRMSQRAPAASTVPGSVSTTQAARSSRPPWSSVADAAERTLCGGSAVHPFPDRDLLAEGVPGLRERARPRWVVRARGVVGEVEVHDERVVVGTRAEVGALHGVEQVATAAVRAAESARERVLDGQEQAAAV